MNNKKIILLLGDVAIFYASLFIALSLRRLELISYDVWENHLLAFSIVLIIWVIVFYINNLYSQNRSLNIIERINGIAFSMVINISLAAIFFYTTSKFWSIKPQTILILTSLIFATILFLWRFAIDRYYSTRIGNNKILFIGGGKTTDELIKAITKNNHLGYQVDAILDNENVQIETIKKTFENNTINTVVISLNYYEKPEIVEALYHNLSPEIRIVNLPHFYEEITGKIPVSQIGHAWVLENFTSRSKNLFDIAKRAFDIISAIILLTITIPLLPFIILAIVLESGFPIFFTQVRVGYKGKHFKAIKFRSMRQDAEKEGAKWAEKNDPRITRFGNIMRKTRIDELPQAINILKGDMSLIGSRPERPVFVEQLSKKIPFYKERLLVKPGLTGWAQVMGPSYGGSYEESLEKLQFDLYYLKNRSLGLDLSIALKTVRIILSRKGQ